MMTRMQDTLRGRPGGGAFPDRVRGSCVQGKPRPVATWQKDGVPLEDRSVGTRTSEVDSILFIRSAERSHSGKYTLSVQIENMCDSADINIQVVGESPPPWAWRDYNRSAAVKAESHQRLAVDNPTASASSRCCVHTGGSGSLADNFLGIISMYG